MRTIYTKLLVMMLLMPFFAIAQSSITGTVMDGDSGMGLPGVSVIIKGTTMGTSTDFDGNFTLSKVTSGDVIVFSYMGYQSQSITYNNQKQIVITLVEDSTTLDEVVLVSVGYGAVRKKDATGSVTSISTKDFNKGANVTAENLLNGRVAGVTINTSGAPGSGSEIRIRGGASLLASNDPLIVLDGLPLENRVGTGGTSLLSSINPNDIESFTVLKDASATAIYGSRASNGVIIINTKRANKALNVEFNTQYGSGRKYNQVDVLNADQYRQLVNSVGTPQMIAYLGDESTDWQDEIYRRTDFVDNNLSLRGNLFNAVPVRLSIGNTYQEGLRLTNKFTRNSVALNLAPEFFDSHLKVKVSANYTNQRNRFADAVEGAAIRFNPTLPVYDSSSPYGGFFEYRNGPNTSNFLIPATRNPVAHLLQTYDTGLNNRLFGNIEMDYKFHFLPELRFVVNAGYDQENGERTRLVGTNSLSGFINGTTLYGTDEYSDSERKNKLLDTYFNYVSESGNIKMDLTAGYSYQKFEYGGFYTQNRRNASLVPRSFRETDVVLIGFFGRTTFTYDDKYILTLSYRRDGTTRFGEDQRWGNFPAAAFAWKMKEDLFSDSEKLSDLKLRLSWGVTGQQEIDNKDFYMPTYSLGNENSQYVFGNSAYIIGVPNATGVIKWEETATYNAGLDFGFWNNRLNGAFDVFYKKSYDLFQIGPFPDGGNYSNQGPQNIGDMSTKGFEFSLGYDVVQKENFNWNVTFNVSKYERRIDEVALGSPLYVGGTGSGTGGTSQIHQEGFTPFSFFVYKQLFDQQTGRAIEGAYADLNGDGIISAEDRYIYRNPDPDLLLGFATSFNYKNFDLGFNVRASIGNRILNTIAATRSYENMLKEGVIIENLASSYYDHTFKNLTGESVISDVFIENGSFLRMDYATMGYTFHNWLEGKASLRLFTTVQNPFIITKYSGLDPEITGGIDNTIYPRQRQFIVGANIKF